MNNKPSVLPEWDTTEVNSISPDQDHKDEGWLAPAGIPEKPPFQTFNFWQNLVYKWLNHLNNQIGTLSDLKNYSGEASIILVKGRTIDYDGYEGVFEFDPSDRSADCAVDTYNGIYVAPSGEDGSNGAWRRIYTFLISPTWFGITLDDSTDSSSLLTAAGIMTEHENKILELPNGLYINGTVNISTVNCLATGEYRIGVSGSLLYKTLIDLTGSLSSKISSDNNNISRFALAREKLKGVAYKGYGGTLTIIGDSFTSGNGAASPDSAYASIVRDLLNDSQKGGYGFELTTNFDETAPGYFSTTGSLGTLGPVGHSLILDVGETLSFTGNYQFIDLFFHRTLTSGSIEVERDGSLVRTINCNGADEDDSLSFTGSQTDTESKDSSWVLTAITNPVEITGLIRMRYTETSAIQVCRIQNSGTATGDYTNTDILTSIKTIGSFYNTSSTFLIALGTNDIYAASKRVLPSVYESNLNTIVNNLQSAGHNVVLWFPPQADEGTWPAVLAPYEEYKKSAYRISQKYNIPIIDLSELNLYSRSLYADGIHPSTGGHKAIALKIIDAFGIPLYDNEFSQADLTYNDDWANYSDIKIIAHKRDNIITLSGICDPQTSTSANIGILPVGFRPLSRSVFTTALTDAGPVQVLIAEAGTVSLPSVPASWASLEGVSFIYDPARV